jgi:hypothetical protein
MVNKAKYDNIDSMLANGWIDFIYLCQMASNEIDFSITPQFPFSTSVSVKNSKV